VSGTLLVVPLEKWFSSNLAQGWWVSLKQITEMNALQEFEIGHYHRKLNSLDLPVGSSSSRIPDISRYPSRKDISATLDLVSSRENSRQLRA